MDMILETREVQVWLQSVPARQSRVFPTPPAEPGGCKGAAKGEQTPLNRECFRRFQVTLAMPPPLSGARGPPKTPQPTEFGIAMLSQQVCPIATVDVFPPLAGRQSIYPMLSVPSFMLWPTLP